VIRLLIGDCRDKLGELADGSVHCVVTSPPYWGLRDYGIDQQLGLEHTPDEYIATMVAVFREVRRVLRPDGTLWLNMGDCYATSVNGRSAADTKAIGNDDRTFRDKPFNTAVGGLKPKDLVGMPWRLVFALQADGWWLRQDIIWSKPNPMPESVTDRCTKAHEYIFLLSKSPRYYFDTEAISESSIGAHSHGKNATSVPNRNDQKSDLNRVWGRSTRNKRSVWEIATAPFSEAHFATFPPDLIEPCIKAGSSEKGCCSKCGSPWQRQVEIKQVKLSGVMGRTNNPGDHNWAGVTDRTRKEVTTLDWKPSCACNTPIASCTVLDPFAGAGTTGLVADRLQRHAVLIELNPQYASMSANRIERDAPLFAQVSTG
jgi:DNA modification methylase